MNNEEKPNPKSYLNKGQIAQVVAFMQANKGQYVNNTLLLEAGFKILGPVKVPKLNSSTVSRFVMMAGLGTHRPPKPESPLDAIYAAERAIKEALKGLDAERDQISQRLIELDNTIAKYRKLI